jgi:hypothetical protein
MSGTCCRAVRAGLWLRPGVARSRLPSRSSKRVGFAEYPYAVIDPRSVVAAVVLSIHAAVEARDALAEWAPGVGAGVVGHAVERREPLAS